jgi:ribose transport system ATP-binding protein
VSQVTAALTVSKLSKTFNGRTVLREFGITIEPGEIHALLGQNGSGKSTLIKALAGYHAPDAGATVQVGGRDLDPGSPASSYHMGCRFVHQDLALVGTMSVQDNLFLTSGYPTRFGIVDRKAGRRTTAKALSVLGLDLDPDRPVAALRPAERTGVAIARALLSQDGALPAVIVLDEPTATLPTHEVNALLSTLRTTAASGVGILYVTHHLDEIRGFAQKVTVLRNGHLVGCWKVDEISSAGLVRQLVGDQLANELTMAQESSRESSKAPAQADGTPILSVSGLQAARLRELSLEVRPGEIVGLYGLTGSGREDALTAIYGSVKREAGSVRVAGQELPTGRPDAAIKAGVGYLPPDRKTLGCVMDHSARHNLTLLDLQPFWHQGTLHRKPEVAEANTWFERMKVEPRNGEGAPLSTFSGGNQQKILLARWLRLSPKVLLLDEPSQGVDVGAKLEVHRQIVAAARAGAAVVVCSSEVEELVSLCERVLVIRNGYVSDELTGASVNIADINFSFHSEKAVQESGKSAHEN